MKSTVLTLSLTALALVCHDPALAFRFKQPLRWDASALSPSMHLSIHDVVMPDLDDFPPVAGGSLSAPPVGSEESIRAVQGMTSSLAMVGALASAPMPTAMTTPAPAVANNPPPVVSYAAPQDQGTRFDLVVNNAPASQVFLQLGSGSGYNILVPPDLTGTITVSLKNTTMAEALESLRELFGYDFRVTGNRVFVYPNTVQTRIYKINYLPGRRQGLSDLHVSSSSITTAGTPSGGSGGSTGTTTTTTSSASGARSDDTAHVRMSSDRDFWREVQDSLVAMVGVEKGRGVVMNPAAGVAVIRANPLEHRHVAEFLKAVKVNIARQVMLEAKIIEVQLTSGSETGVNWALFAKRGTADLTLGTMSPNSTLARTVLDNNNTTVLPGPTLGTAAQGFYGLAVQTSNFMALINFLQTQGDVQVLSSPRIATMNNQKAVLKVGSDELFVTGVKSDSTSSGNSTITTPTLTLQPFFSGISLDVTPQIDDAGAVMMHIHPAISSVTEKQKTVDLGNLGLYKLPLASSAINETDSIVKVQDGHIVAIGGLMRVSSTQDRAGLPGVSEVPGLGALFRQKQSYTNKRELVVLIRPTVIDEQGNNWERDEPNAPMLAPLR